MVFVAKVNWENGEGLEKNVLARWRGLLTWKREIISKNILYI